MKRLICSIAIALGATGMSFAQNSLKPGQIDTLSVLNSADNMKTMNRQQALTNYLQAEAKNLTSTSKGIQLKASIFALNWKDSASKYKDTYYLDHTWQRNTQLIAGGGTDKNNKFDGVTLGFTSSIFNKRDISLIRTYDYLTGAYNKNIPSINILLDSIRKTALTQYITTRDADLEKIIIKDAQQAFDAKTNKDFKANLINDLPPAGGQSQLEADKSFDAMFNSVDADLLTDIRNNVFDLKPGVPKSDVYYLADEVGTLYFLTPLNDQLTDYINYASKNGVAQKITGSAFSDLTALIKQIDNDIKMRQGSMNGKDLVSVYTYLHMQYKNASAKLASRPLLTYGYTFMYATTGIKDQHIPNLQFLVGLGGRNSPNEYEFTVTLSDTTGTDTVQKSKPLSRNISALQLGINKVLLTDKSSTSLLEANLAMEEDHVWADLYAKESRNKVYAAATLQGRLSSKSPWLKLMIKYNKKANFLGFLDVTMNLDNSSASSSKAN